MKPTVKLAALGTAAVLATTALTVNAKPAQAGDEFLGAALGGLIGSLISGGSRGGSPNVSAKQIREAAKKVLIYNGLMPLDRCNVGAVSVTLGTEEVCAMPNHRYGPGTYRIHNDTYALIPYGMTSPVAQPPVYSAPQPSAYPSPSQPPIYPGMPQPSPQPPAISVTYPSPAYPTSPQSSAANGAIYRTSGQPISPPDIARLRSLLAGNNIAEAACGASPQQVTVIVNSDFIVCGHPTNHYPPGNYKFTLDGLY